MTPDELTSQVRSEWVNRQREHGNKPRAVLMKNLPAPVNDLIDAWHRTLMHAAFPSSREQERRRPSLDLGCGYGRLADQALLCGLDPLVGIDFAHGFCADFERNYGPSVCGDLASLPFADNAFADAYAVTALMYLPFEQARRAVLEIDRCCAPGARILLVEPGREFNSLVRMVLRRKRSESLAMPGFSRQEFTAGIVPANWSIVSCGSSDALTALLPLLMATSRWPAIYRPLARLALFLDTPRAGKSGRTARVCMYRWAVYRKPQ